MASTRVMFSAHPKAQYWHPTKNGDLTPDNVSTYSNKKIWFICYKCNHDFETVIQSITRQNVWCPYCSVPTKKLCENNEDGRCQTCFQKSFASHEKAQYWDKDKNKINTSNVIKNSHDTYWFNCDCGHSFEIVLKCITGQNIWCPYCAIPSKKLCENNEDGHCQTCFQKSFACHEKVKYWDRNKNNEHPSYVFKKSAKKCWFNCDCGHSFDISLHNLCCQGSWCQYCSNQILCENNEDGHCQTCFQKSFASHDIAKYWDKDKNKIDSSAIFKISGKKYHFKCDCGHSVEKTLSSINKQSLGCPYCSVPTKKLCDNNEDGHCKICFQKSFASHTMCKYWDMNKNKVHPSLICKGSEKTGWFKCKYGHLFEMRLYCITGQNTWCPYCINKTEQKLFDALSIYYPDLVQQFRVEWCKNKSYLPFDFVIESKKVIIELDGPQHFIQISNWQPPEEIHMNDMYKMKCANQNGYTIIRLLQEDVYYDTYDWLTELQSVIHSNHSQNIFLSKNGEYDGFIVQEEVQSDSDPDEEKLYTLSNVCAQHDISSSSYPTYFNMKLDELKILCKERNIKGFSKKKKDDLIKMLEENDKH